MSSILRYHRRYRLYVGSKGFTLLEVLVVVAIVAALAAIAVPSFFKWSQSAKFKGAALGVASDLNLSRQLAVTSNVECRVELDVDGRRYRITRGNLSSGSTSWALEKPWADLDAEVSWATGTACNGSADMNVMFRPNGSSDGGTVCIKDSGGTDRYKVVVNSITGRVYVE